MNPSSSPTTQLSFSPSESKPTVTAQIQMYLYNISTLLDSEQVETFELVSLVYLKQKLSPVEIATFDIISQSEVKLNRRIRGLSEAVGSNIVKIEGSITAIVDTQNPITYLQLLELFETAIQNSDYDETLQQNEYLKFVSTSFQLNQPIQTPDPTKEPKLPPHVEVDDHNGGDKLGDGNSDKKKSSKSTTVTVISVVLLSAFFVGLFVARKKIIPLMERIKERVILEGPSNDSSSSYSCETLNQDELGEIAAHSQLSRCLKIHSSDDSPINLDFMNNSTLNMAPHTEEGKGNAPALSTRNVKKNLFTSSPSSPQMSHIPPMIVIDNIDEEIDSGHEDDTSARTPRTPKASQEENGEDTQGGLFVKRIEATSDLVAALSASKPPNPKQAYNLLK